MSNTFTNVGDKISNFVLINLSEGNEDHPLPENKDITIGRHEDNIIVISSDFGYVSRFHAIIRVRGGKCFFEDLADNKNDSCRTSAESYESNSAVWKRFKKGDETPIHKDTVIRLGGEREANPDIPNAKVCDIKIVVANKTHENKPTVDKNRTITNV